MKKIIDALKSGDLKSAALEMAKKHKAPAAVLRPLPDVETGALPQIALLAYAKHYLDHGMYISTVVSQSGTSVEFAPWSQVAEIDAWEKVIA